MGVGRRSGSMVRTSTEAAATRLVSFAAGEAAKVITINVSRDTLV
jgi:F0F1-type ATP synthase assembly protein I